MISFPANTYTILHHSGSVSNHKQTSSLLREQAEKILDGPVEFVPLAFPEIQMIVPAEGRLRRLGENRVASSIVGYPIYGSALILTGIARWQ